MCGCVCVLAVLISSPCLLLFCCLKLVLSMTSLHYEACMLTMIQYLSGLIGSSTVLTVIGLSFDSAAACAFTISWC